jgi:hypothetical protein
MASPVVRKKSIGEAKASNALAGLRNSWERRAYRFRRSGS